MTRTKLWGFAALVALALPLATPAQAIHIGIGINLTPPAERVEVVPARPHDGYVWIKGHWVHRDGDWAWVDGHWDNPPRMGAVWVPGHLNKRGEWVEGHWR